MQTHALSNVDKTASQVKASCNEKSMSNAGVERVHATSIGTQGWERLERTTRGQAGRQLCGYQENLDWQESRPTML